MNEKSKNGGPRIVIIGAGPTGLGAAYRLHELGQTNFTVLERNPYPGGLSASFVDEMGFTWDIGGHVLFSHYPYFDQVMDLALKDAWVSHTRQSHIWLSGRFIPYPFQNNLHHLPPEQISQCVRGLVRAVRNNSVQAHNFHDWLRNTFGDAISQLFMCPYNLKVWAHPLQSMSYNWIAERVATVNIEQVLDSIIFHRDAAGWGPNHTFRFPLRGGTGAVWKAVAALIPADRIRYHTKVIGVDTARAVVQTSDGHDHQYDYLISTLPLDRLAELSGCDRWCRLTSRLKYTTTHVVGLGFRGQVPQMLRTRNWMYFPEADYPFYRVTVFSNYSHYNVPEPHNCWSVMAEISSSVHAPVSTDRLVEDVLRALRHTRLTGEDEPVANWVYTARRGYPVPTIERDDILNDILPELEQNRVYSRGRFGAWRYEVGNQDHSFHQGVEVVNRLLRGMPETTVMASERNGSS